MKKQIILTLIAVVSLMAIVFAAKPALTNVGFTYDYGTGTTSMFGDLQGGFILPLDGNSSTKYLVQFDNSTGTNNSADGMYGLYLIYSTVNDSTLKAYYATKPGPYDSYLNDSVDGINPFAYINVSGGTPTLVDAAQYDLPPNHIVDMVIPGDYPLGTYLIAGELTGTDGNKSSVVFKLIITDETNQQTEVEVQADLTLTPTPNPLDFGVLKPGMSSQETVTLTPGTSDLDVSVNITGDSLMQTIETYRTGSWTALKGDNFVVNASTALSFDAKLDIPVGQQSGNYAATIVYTVLENTTP
jgi:hypothetical protein